MNVKEILILDNNKQIVKFLGINDGNEESTIFEDKYTQYLDTGAETFEFTTKVTDIIAEYLTEGNYVMFMWNNKAKMFQIKTCKDDEKILNTNRTVYCECVGLELLNSHVRPTLLEGNVKTFLPLVLQDTNYKVGFISPTLEQNVQSFKIDKITPVYTVLQDAIEVFGGLEYEFRVEPINTVNGKYEFYIDVYADGERGDVTCKRYEYDFNTYGSSRTGDITDFCSGLVAEGANGITFKDLEWIKEDGDPLDKPLGQDFLLDPEAHAMLNNGDKYVLGSYSSNATTPIDLLMETYHKLQEVKKVKFSYTIPIHMTADEYQSTNIGDTVYVVNPKFNPSIQLEARIGVLEISLTDNSQNKISLSNFKELKSRIRNLDPHDIIKDTINAITGMGVGKLTEANILVIKDYLTKLDVEASEIDKVITALYDKYNPPIPLLPPNIPEDSEDYTKITVSKLDGGLWLGDDRIHSIIKHAVATVITQTETTVERPVPSTASSQEYKEAVKYYNKFDLGTKKDSSAVTNIMSNSNKYKIGYMVRYWAGKFGLDTRLIYALMLQESSGDPYCATSTSIGGYGLMQCERGVYFNKKATMKFIDGTTKTFTPSYSTMTPKQGGTTTVNGVTVDKNINNQIMFGCNELRQRLEQVHYNIFACLVGYNMGSGAINWITIKYVCDTYGYTFKNGYSLNSQSAQIKKKVYEVWESFKFPFADWRQIYANQGGAGTVKHVEYVLRYYKPYENSLPYCKDKNGKKIGYGVNPPAIVTPSPAVGSVVRDKIVALAKDIVQDHKDGKATYDQAYRTIDFKKPRRHPGTFYGLKNPICYDCSSFVSCCYLHAGLKSAYNGTCSGGTLVANAVKKSGWSAWKCNDAGVAKAKPGDIIMDANSRVTETGNISNPKKYRTHHTLIYCGNGMVAHASKWAYKPNAIRYESINYYKNKGTAFFLRPYDIAEADKKVTPSESTGGTDETIIYETIVQETKIVEQTLKGLRGAKADDYLVGDYLVQDVTINDVSDTLKFPTTTIPYVFVHFGINDLTPEGIQATKNILLRLKQKYKNTPIFIAKELYVTSAYPNHAEVNEDIANFNNEILGYCNEHDYIIQLDISKGIATNNTINSSLTTDGFSMKDKASTTKYYNAVKDAIKNKRIGGLSIYTNPVTNVTNVADVTMAKTKVYTYKVVQNVYMRLARAVTPDFWSRLIFKTNKDSEPTRFSQSDLVFLEGTDCRAGALLPKADTTYTITVFANVEDGEYNGLPYYGTVTGVDGGGSYTDFADFVGGETLGNCALSYYNNRTNLTYTVLDKTPMDFTNPAENISQWKVGNKMNIASRAMTKLCSMGIDYDKSPYANNDLTKVTMNTLTTWAWNPTLGASNQAKYSVQQGWAMTGIDMDNFSNVEKGDIIYYSRSNNSNFMSISDVAICVGTEGDKVMAVGIDSLGTSKTVIKFALNTDNTTYKPSQIILIVRPRKE